MGCGCSSQRPSVARSSLQILLYSFENSLTQQPHTHCLSPGWRPGCLHFTITPFPPLPGEWMSNNQGTIAVTCLNPAFLLWASLVIRTVGTLSLSPPLFTLVRAFPHRCWNVFPYPQVELVIPVPFRKPCFCQHSSLCPNSPVWAYLGFDVPYWQAVNLDSTISWLQAET